MIYWNHKIRSSNIERTSMSGVTSSHEIGLIYLFVWKLAIGFCNAVCLFVLWMQLCFSIYRIRWMVLFQLISSGGISRLVWNHLNMVEHVHWSHTQIQIQTQTVICISFAFELKHVEFPSLVRHWPPPTAVPLCPLTVFVLFFSFFPSDTDDSGLVDVYDNQCHVWVPGIQPWTPVTQLLRVLVGPRTFKIYSSA